MLNGPAERGGNLALFRGIGVAGLDACVSSHSCMYLASDAASIL
jgi:hypothetical protein